MTDELNGQRAVNGLRGKAAHLEHTVKKNLMYDRMSAAADVALLCSMLAEFIERFDTRLGKAEEDIEILGEAEDG